MNRIIIIRNNTSVVQTWIRSFIANEEFQVPNDNTNYIKYANSVALQRSILIGEASIGNGGEFFIDENRAINWLKGLDGEQNYVIDGKVQVGVTFQNHGADHSQGGSDEINVEGISGVLANEQNPIPSKVVAALGIKDNSNSLNHDRFQVSDIQNLSSSQTNFGSSLHDNQNDPSTNEKGALAASDSPNTSNPFITKLKGDTIYSSINHGHSTLPTQSQKDALDAANSPGSLNKLVTQSDLDSIGTLRVVQNFSGLPLSTVVGEAWKVLEDETINLDLYEAGWYSFAGTGLGIYGSDWFFHSTKEAHSHFWSDIDKSGSKLSDIENVPVVLNDGNKNVLVEQSNLLSWEQQQTSVGSGVRKFYINVQKQESSKVRVDSWFDAQNSDERSGSVHGFKSKETYPSLIPFTSKIIRIILNASGANYQDRSSAGNIFFALSFYKHNYNSVEKIVTIGSTVQGSFDGDGVYNINLFSDDSAVSVLSGNNSLQAGNLIGVKLDAYTSVDGAITTLKNPTLLIELEEF